MKDILDKVKYVLFDFDDTLCIHTNHTGEEWDAYINTYSDEPFKTCFKSTVMQEFIDICTRRGIRMGFISAVELPFRSVIKSEWITENYGVCLENYCTSKVSDKAKMCQYVMGHYNLEEFELMIVDDFWDTLRACEKVGVKAVSPIWVAEYIDSVRRELCEKKNTDMPIAI